MPLVLKPRGKKKILWIYGSFGGESIRESTRSSNRRIAEARLSALMKDIEQRAIYGTSASFTFAEAMEFYVRRTNPKPKQAWYLTKLLNYWGKWRCQDITPQALMAYEKIRHSGKSVTNNTLRRSIYGPMNAILKMAAENRFCLPVLLPKPKLEKSRVAAAPEGHLRALLACKMADWLRAVVLTMTLHGTRPSDLKRLKWQDVSFSSNVITFRKTKNGEPHSPVMHPEVRAALLRHRASNAPFNQSEPVFAKLQCNEPATTINQYVKGLCKRNNLPFYSTHKIGRHAFAERIMDAGYTLNDLQKAGNWSTITVVAERYAHLERTRVDDIVTGMRISTNPGQFPEVDQNGEEDQALTK